MHLQPSESSNRAALPALNEIRLALTGLGYVGLRATVCKREGERIRSYRKEAHVLCDLKHLLKPCMADIRL